MILAVGAISSLGVYLTLVLFSPQIASQSSISACKAACPENGLLVTAEPSLVLEIVRVGRAGVILVALAAIGFIVWRVVNGTPPRRRALVVGAPVAVAFLLSQAAYQTARLLEIEGDAFYSVAQWTLVADASVDLVRVPGRADRGGAVRGAGAAPRGDRLAAAPGAG